MFSFTAGTHVLLEREIVREGMSEMEFPECRAFLWTFSPSDVFPRPFSPPEQFLSALGLTFLPAVKGAI